MIELNNTAVNNEESLLKVLGAILTDMTNTRSALNTAVSKINVLTTKLNSDGGVSDTNYATDFAQATDLTLTGDASY